MKVAATPSAMGNSNVIFMFLFKNVISVSDHTITVGAKQ